MPTETTTDPFELSDDDFEAQKQALMGEPTEADEPTQPVQDIAEIVLPVEDPKPGQDTPENAPASPEPEQPLQEQMVTLIHLGEEKVVPMSEAVKLAQMGFDYTSKMQKIAPHRKIVDLIESDEELQKKVNAHIEDKTKVKLAPIDEFDNEDQWLEENLKRSKKALLAPVKQEIPTEVQTTIDRLAVRDPQNYQTVLKRFDEFTAKLTVEEYSKINHSPDELDAFYDKVKAQVINPKAAVPQRKQSPFRMKTSGGPVPRDAKRQKNAWELPGKEFDALLQKVKGY